MQYGWSLQIKHWRELAKAVSGCKWHRCYLERDYAIKIPTSTGIYLICACARQIPISGKVMEHLYNAVYVGQTSNLQRRFREHVRVQRGRILDAKKIFRRLDFWYSELSRDHLSETEQLLVDAFGPTANVKNIKARIGEPVPADPAIGDSQ